jgi:hypothetical protein
VTGGLTTLAHTCARFALAVTLAAAPAGTAASADGVSDVAVKAAFLFNFAKFAEWPSLAAGARIVVCVVGDESLAAAVTQTLQGKALNGHGFDVWQPRDSANWRDCQLLFMADPDTHRFSAGLNSVKALPVLTVSDGTGFSEAGGIIELYVEAGRMRFAINVDAAERSGLRISSRLLRLAKVVRNDQAQ